MQLNLLTGISSIFGLIGVLFYSILKIQGTLSKNYFSTETIEALKVKNIDPKKLQNLTSKQIEAFFQGQSSISKKLVNKISIEVNKKIQLLKIMMFSSFLLALIFFIFSQINSKSNNSAQDINVSKDTIETLYSKHESEVIDTTILKEKLVIKNENVPEQVILVLNSNMSTANIYINGKQASIISNNLNTKIIKLTNGAGDYNFLLKCNGKEFNFDTYINKNNQLITIP